MSRKDGFCNICGETEFADFNGRVGILCSTCKSLERHRLVRWTLESLGYLESEKQWGKRLLHLAPEEMTHRYLMPVFGGGGVCADLVPSKYPHAQCLKLALPVGFDIFPEGYFDLILHNHVLEHIPGDYRDHLASFWRLLRPGGNMVFTVPNVSSATKTVQGGELLPSDEERVRLHGQFDHYKSFGYDFLEYFGEVPGTFWEMEIPMDVRVSIRARYDPVHVLGKD